MPPWSYNRSITRRHVNASCFNNPQCVPAALQMASKQGLRRKSWAFSDVCSKHDESDVKSFKVYQMAEQTKVFERTLMVNAKWAEMKRCSHFSGGVQNTGQPSHTLDGTHKSRKFRPFSHFHSLTWTCCQGFHAKPFWLRKECALHRDLSHHSKGSCGTAWKINVNYNNVSHESAFFPHHKFHDW